VSGPADFATEEELAGIAADRAEAHAEAAEESKVDIARVEDVDAGGVPARRYVPDQPAGALLYLHGGGFALGDLVTHDGFARRLADRTRWAVLMPDYRRSPEHAWPAAAEDAAAAADWLAGQAGDQGHDRVVVVGDSAGSALAIGEVIRHPERYAGQVQVYPFIDPSAASYDHGLTGADLPVDRCDLFWRLYLQGAAAADPALQVLDHGDLAGQPPALVQLAEHDVLTPTGHRYAERLTAAGVPVRVEVYPGVQHGFWRRTDNDQADPALDRVALFLSTL
jgi:acetyl esterase